MKLNVKWSRQLGNGANREQFFATNHAVCNATELYEAGLNGAVETGRWIVVDKATSNRRSSTIATKNNMPANRSDISLVGYQQGLNSLGVRMEYAPRKCRMLSNNQALRSLQCAKKKHLHIIYIGDSNLRMQYKLFDESLEQFLNISNFNMSSSEFPTIETTRISTYGGLRETMSNVSEQLAEIRAKHDARSNHQKEYFILFNSGLHDINRRCATPKTERKLDFNTSCTQDYEESLWELLRLLDTFPATLKVFQSTTAGWPKYGNYGFAWPPSIPQLLPRDPTFVAHFNNAADRVLSKYNKKIAAAKTKAGGGSYRSIIPTMDAYWLTLARPDHRQVDKDNFIGKHLAHAGPEVYTFLVRKWTMLVLEATCGLGYYALQYESHPRRIIDKD